VRLHRCVSAENRVRILLTSILIVDDEEGVRKMLSSVLNDEGYLVEAVENGKKAIKACQKSVFDVALIDIELPDMKGTELLNRLKKQQPKMVRIIITGHPSLESAMKAVNEKADGYVLKPFEVTGLLAIIKRVFNEKTEEYLRVIAETAHEKESTPAVKYQSPDKW
jgi:putative two-component system response regulator